jgi:hypothetical protein
MADRRDFLKVFGLGAVIVPNSSLGADRSAAAELVRIPEPAAVPYGAWVDVVSDWLYSGVEIKRNSMAGRYHLFCSPIGQLRADGGQVDFSDTNMLSSCHLPPPETFAITRVGVLFSPTTEPKLRALFAERYTLRLRIAEKSYFCQPVAAIFAEGKPSRRDAPASADDLRGSLALDIPVVIPSQMQFSAELTGLPLNGAHGRLKLWAYLAGRMVRSVQ